jgi:hypothetical protein
MGEHVVPATQDHAQLFAGVIPLPFELLARNWRTGPSEHHPGHRAVPSPWKERSGRPAFNHPDGPDLPSIPPPSLVQRGPSPTLGDALNAGYLYLEVRCLGCDTHQTVALDIVRRLKSTPIHELERYMRCKDCSEVRGDPYKRSHLVALRRTKSSASDPPSHWWPGEHWKNL